VSLDERYGYSQEPDDVERRVEDKAVLLELAQILCGDALAHEEAANSILQSARPGEQPVAGRWLESYFAFAEFVEKLLARVMSRDLAPRPVHMGELAVLPSVRNRLRVVSEVSDFVRLVDFGEDDRKIRYQKDRVVGLEGNSAVKRAR
jgi:hypothetical protein